MGGFRYRVIDTSGSEIAIVADDRLQIAHDETVMLPDGRTAAVLEVNDDEVDGGDGGVVATLVVDDGRQARGDCAGRAFKRSGPATGVLFASELLASRASRVGGLRARARTSSYEASPHHLTPPTV